MLLLMDMGSKDQEICFLSLSHLARHNKPNNQDQLLLLLLLLEAVLLYIICSSTDFFLCWWISIEHYISPFISVISALCLLHVCSDITFVFVVVGHKCRNKPFCCPDFLQLQITEHTEMQLHVFL